MNEGGSDVPGGHRAQRQAVEGGEAPGDPGMQTGGRRVRPALRGLVPQTHTPSPGPSHPGQRRRVRQLRDPGRIQHGTALTPHRSSAVVQAVRLGHRLKGSG